MNEKNEMNEMNEKNEINEVNEMMEQKIIDCRGLACPKPVLETKDALEGIGSGEELVVLVDNEAAKGNVKRFARSQGCEVNVEEQGDDNFRIIIRKIKDVAPGPMPEIACSTSQEDLAVVFPADKMGEGDEGLGELLMDAFCHTLLELKPVPRYLIFYNRGVFLVKKGSKVLDAIVEFEKKGATVLVCGTCLKHYGLEEDLGVGRVSNMFEILEAMGKVQKILRP